MSSPRPDTDYDSLAKKAWGVTTPSKVGGYKPRTKTSGNPDFDNLYDEKGKQYDIDPDLLIAQGRQESAFRPNAKSPAGARGIAQFMSGTAKEFGVNPNDVGSSIDGQARLMRSLIDRTNDVDLALAGYNSGHNASIDRLKRNKERIPETRNYVAKIGQEYRTPTTKPTTSLDDIAKKAWAASPYDDIAKQAWGAVEPTVAAPDIPHEAPHTPTGAKDREALQPVDTTAIDAMMRAPQREPVVKVPTQRVQRPTKGKPTQRTTQPERRRDSSLSGITSVPIENIPTENIDNFLSRQALTDAARRQGLGGDAVDAFLASRGGNILQTGTQPYTAEEIASYKDRGVQKIEVSFDKALEDDFRRFATDYTEAKTKDANEQLDRQELRANIDEKNRGTNKQLSFTDPLTWKMAWDELWKGNWSGTITEEDRQLAIDNAVAEQVKNAGSAGERLRLDEEYKNLSNFDKGVAHVGDIYNTIQRAPASFAKTAAWIEDTTGYLREKGIILPWVTTTDIAQGLDWIASKTLGLQPSDIKQGALPTLFADAVEKMYPDDKRTANTMMGKIARGTGSAVPFLLGAMATGGGSVATGLLGAGMQVGEMYDTAQKEGLSREKQLLSGALGIPIGASEAWGLKWAKLGELINKGSKGVFLKSFTEWLKSTGKDATEEALQEFLQSTSSKLTITALKNNGVTLKDVTNAIGDSIEDATVGGIVGALFGGGVPLAVKASGKVSEPVTKARTDALLKTEPEASVEPVTVPAQQETPKVKVKPNPDAPLVPTDLRGISVNEKGETTYAGETKAEIEERRRFERATPNITAQQVQNLAEDKGIDIATVTDKPLAEMSADELRVTTRAIEAVTAPRKVDPKRKSVFEDTFDKEVVEKPKKKIKPKTEVTEVEQPVEIPVDKPTITKGTTVYKGKLGGEVLRVKDGKANVQIYLPDGSLGDQIEYDVDELSTVAPTTVDAVSTEKPKTTKFTVPTKSKGKFEAVKVEPYTQLEHNKYKPNEQLKFNQGVYYEPVRLIADPDLIELITAGSRFRKGRGNENNETRIKQLEKELGISMLDAHTLAKNLAKENRDTNIEVFVHLGNKEAKVSPTAKSATPKVGDKVENIIGGWKGTIAEVDGDLVVKRGKEVWGDYSPVNYTSVDEMFKRPVEGSPEFNKATELANLPKRGETFLKGVESTAKEGFIDLSPEAVELGRVIDKAVGRNSSIRFGSTYTKAEAIDHIEGAKDLRQVLKDRGMSTKAIDKYIADFEKVAKENQGIVPVGIEASRKHETLHSADLKSRIINSETAKDLVVDGEIKQLKYPKLLKTFRGNLETETGRTHSDNEVIAEAIGYLGEGDHERFGLTQVQAAKVLADIGIARFNSLVEAYDGDVEKAKANMAAFNIEGGEKIYEAIKSTDNGKGVRPSTESGQKREGKSETAGSKDVGDAETAGQGTATTEESNGVKLKSRTPGKSGLASDPEKVAEAKAQGKKVAAISKMLGIEDYYTPQGHEQTEANVNEILGEMTFDQAVTQAIHSTPSPEASRILAREAQRLVGIAESYRQQGKPAEFMATLQRAGEIVGALKIRQIQTGREVEIQKMLEPLTPEAAVVTAEYLYQMTFDKPMSHAQRDEVFNLAKENQRLQGELATAEMKLAEQDRIIAEIDNNVPEKKPFNHQEALLRNYQKRKPILLAELKKRFPNSSAFQGDVMLMAVGKDTSKDVVIDPKTAKLLEEYAIGQILTDRSYEAVIRELQDISGASEAQVKDIHARAANKVRGAKEPQSEEAKKRIQIRKEHYTEAEKHANPEKIVERAIKAAESALTRQIKILEEEIANNEKADKEKKTLISDKLTELRAKRDKLKTEHNALFNPPKVTLVKVPMTQAQKVDRAKAARLRKEIAEVNKEIATQERRAKEIKPVYLPSVETQQLQRQLADAKAKRDAIFEAKGIPQQERIAKAEKAAREALQTLRKKVADHDLAVVRGKPVKSGALTAIRAEQKELRKALNDLRKANTQTVTGLSRYGQKSLDKNPEDIELAIAVDLLSNKAPKSIDSVILKLQNDYGFTPPEAKEIAQQAKQTIKDFKVEDARARDKAKGISDEQREIINQKRAEQMQAANRLNRFLSTVANNPTLIKRFNDDFRIKLVANWGTQIFNAVQVATVATPAQLALDVLEIGLQSLGVKIGEQTEIRARDLLLPYYYMFSANRQIAEQALSQFPELFFEVHKGLLGDLQITPLQLADTKNGLSKVAHKWFDINAKYNEFATKWSGAKMFEMHFRNSVIASSFDQAIRAKTNGKETLQSVMKEGKLREYITEETAKRAAKRAMDVTFASEIDDPLGKELKHIYDKLDNYLPVLLNPITYARFMYSTSKQAVINPLMFGAMDSKKLGGAGYSTRSIAKGALAYSTLAMAGAILSSIGGDDDKWYTLYPLGKDGPVLDIRRSYPLAAYFYIAHNIIQSDALHGFKDSKPMDTDVLGGLVSIETEYFRRGAPMEFAGAVGDFLSQKKDIGSVGESGARLVGSYLSGLTRAAKPLRDLFAQFNADERAYREDPEGAKDKFLNELSRSIPGVIRLSDQKKQTDIDGKVMEQPFPAGRIFGVNIIHPDFTREAGSTATQWADRLWDKDYDKMTPDEKRKFTLRNQIKKAAQAGKMDIDTATQRIDDYVAQGKLSKESGTQLKAGLGMSQLEAKIKTEFSPDNATDVKNLKTVLSYATPAEKEALTKILLKKTMTPEMRKDLGVNRIPESGVDEMLNAKEMKNATTDDLVSYMNLEGYTAEEKAKVTQALLQKAGNALKSKTLTAEEIENIKTVLPDFSETGAQKAISSAKIASSNLSDDIKSTFDSLGISAPSVGDSLTPKKGGEKIKLTPEQQAKYERETIERIEAKVRSLQTTTAYKNAPENVRKKMIEGIIRKQRSEEQKETKSEMLKAPKLADLAYAKDGGSDFEPRPIEYPDSPDKWKGQRLSTNIIDKRKGSKLDMFANLITGDIGEIRQAKFDGRGVERAEAKRLLNEQIAEARYGIKKGATNAKQVLGELLKLRARF